MYLEIITTKEWGDTFDNMKNLSLIVCDHNGNYWKILFG